MSEPAVIYEKYRNIGIITLNRPQFHNAMETPLFDGLEEAIDAVLADHNLRCVVLTGREKYFSSGANLHADLQRKEGARTLLPHETSFAMYKSFLRLLEIEVPVIGALNGHTVGGGFGLALLCDMRIVAEEAKVGAPFVRLGIHPGLAVNYLLPRLIGVASAAELLFTGKLISGNEACRLGIASRALPSDEVLPAAMKLAEEIAASAPLAVRLTKQSFYEGLGWHIQQAAMRESFAQANTVQTEDAKEGVAAILEKRAPNFMGR